jgi:branched-chain amino acid transport system ATP-binding protein
LVNRVLVVVRRLREAGTAVLLVEQLIEKALALADRVYALARGSIVLEARTGEADLPQRLEHAYLATAGSPRVTRPAGECGESGPDWS